MTQDRLGAALGALLCFGLCGWLAWAEWGPGGLAGGAAAAVDTRRPPPDPEDIVDSAHAHIEARRWAEALDVLQLGPTDGPNAEEAGSLRMHAILEQRAAAKFMALQRQLVDGERTRATVTLRAIPSTSVYRIEAERLVKGRR